MSFWDVALMVNPITAPFVIGSKVIGGIFGDEANKQATKIVDEQAPKIAGPYAEQAGHSFVKGAIDELESRALGLFHHGADAGLKSPWQSLDGLRNLFGG